MILRLASANQAPPACRSRAAALQPPFKRQRHCMGRRDTQCRSLEQEYLSKLTRLTMGADGEAEDGRAPSAPASRDTDTIAAIVTGSAQGAVSIIRLSGPEAVATAQRVFRPAGLKAGAHNGKAAWEPESHRVYYGTAVDEAGRVLDEVLLLAMLAPRSYTSEDVVELHTHGGGVSAARVLQRCLAAGARRATPGEFTLRAFLNGRLDLAQAESVAQLIDARTVAAADSALAGLAGGLGREVAAMRAECVDLLVELDARLDFDDDLPPLDVPALVARVAALDEQLQRTLATARQGQLLRTGLQVALVGRPNVGKSSLLNALSGTDRAIVTDIAGTTRDIVEAGIVIGGVPITLLDTAGLRESSDLVEQIGVERSVAAARQADIVLVVLDAQAGWTQGDADITEQLFGQSAAAASSGDGDGSGGGQRGAPALLVLNKSDLAQRAQQQAVQQAQQDGSQQAASPPLQQGCSSNSATQHAAAAPATLPSAEALGVPPAVAARFAAVVGTSAATREGLEELQAAVLRLAGAPELAPGGVSWAVNERQAEALIRAGEALERVQGSIVGQLPMDFWTIDLRAAALALGEVSGDEVTEEVLESIFSRFCIGK